jgi:hypothetical protein
MPPIKYHTDIEIRDSKRKHALDSYYRGRLRDSVYLQQKKDVKEAMKTKEFVLAFHKLLLTLQAETLQAETLPIPKLI